VSITKAADEQLLDVRVARTAPWKRWYLRNERLILGLAGFVVVLLAWELVVQMGWLRAVFISSPSRIWRATLLEVQVGRIWGDIGASLLVYVLGFGAGRGQIVRTVVLPSTIPFIMTGLRLASGRALVGVVLAELIAANQGIGFMISLAGTTLNTARMMVGVLLLGIFGVLIGEVMRRIEARFDAWRPQIG
jgi:ABC-type nitrate/sulfonate/bicarbonate transport system permease component